MTQRVTIAIAGLGTVGQGVLKHLHDNRAVIQAHTGTPFEVIGVSARNKNRPRVIDITPYPWFDDPIAMVKNTQADIIVELIGGAQGVAKTLCQTAIEEHKHVVTANKALLAHYGESLALQAENAGVYLAFDAAVGGGIPILTTLKQSLCGNHIQKIEGILNGTSNYILSTMEETGQPFSEALLEAQQKGYAEADPTFDVDGTDTAHKLTLLAAIAFSQKPRFDDIQKEGIQEITPLDITYAKKLGYRIKLLGVATLSSNNKTSLRVGPVFIPKHRFLAGVKGVFNAVEVIADFAGPIVLTGQGAGMDATASAVVGDIINIITNRASYAFGVASRKLTSPQIEENTQEMSRFYLRFCVTNEPGVVGHLSTALGQEGISLEAILQEENTVSKNAIDENNVGGNNVGGNNTAHVLFVTNKTTSALLNMALHKMKNLPILQETPKLIRIDDA